jgi:hypothetical protein
VTEEFNDFNVWGFVNWSVIKWCPFEWSNFKIFLRDQLCKTCCNKQIWPFKSKLLEIYCTADVFVGMKHLELLSGHVQIGPFVLIRFLLF